MLPRRQARPRPPPGVLLIPFRQPATCKAVLLITSELQELMDVCDRIIVMDSGRVVTSGVFEDIVRNSEVMQTYLGRPQ